MTIRRKAFYDDTDPTATDEPPPMPEPAPASAPEPIPQPAPSIAPFGQAVDDTPRVGAPERPVAPVPAPTDPTTPPFSGATPPVIPPLSPPPSAGSSNYVLAGMPLGNATDSPKRAATAYLNSGAANPSGNWAQAAADYLNATYPQYGNVFKAIDGETLGYGDEFIHSAPVGYGLQSGQYDPNAAGEFFWGSNGPGPWDATPTGGSGGTGGSGSTKGGTPDLSSLLSLFGNLGGTYGGPGTSGVYPSDYLQQVGQDPFSQLITGGLSALIGSGGKGLGGVDTAQAMEAARAPYEAARKVQLENARSELASRGLLSEPGVPQGSEVGAIGRIEQNLAPAYTAAIDQNLLELRNQSNTEARTMLDALNAASSRQGMLGQLALQSLAQNTAFNEFLAEFGLKRDQALYAIASGQNEQILLLFQQWLNATQISAGGHV